MSQAALTAVWPGEPRARALATGLWAFIGVAGVLFALFIVAYAMRMDSGNWSRIGMPPQLWVSSALLVAGSVLLQRASLAAHRMALQRARRLFVAGGAAAALFLCAQLWAWQHLIDARVMLASNAAASFFYLLTALHGLHVVGGLVAWSVVAPQVLPRDAEPRAAAWRITLTARYWHFLLVAWGALFAALGWLTPEFVAFICGRG